MKRIIAFVIAALMLCAALGALAEEAQLAPLYATVGDALKDSAEGRLIAGGVPGEYYAIVTEKDGKYYRSIAICDEKLNELTAAVDSLDYEAEDFFEKFEAAMQAADDYRDTLPIAYSEEFTAQPLTDEEMAACIGKTLGQLTEEGFEIGSNGTETDENDEMYIAYTLRYGVYDYACIVDADFDRYEAAKENDTEDDLTVTGMTLAGITEWGFDQRFHTDGTEDEQEDPFAEFSAIMTEVGQMIEKARAGEEIDIESFIETMKAEHPDYADMIDMYLTLYQIYGLEGFASMMTPAEAE